MPCIAGSCGANAPQFVTSGSATAVATASKLTVNQSSATAVLNWSSFNVGAGNSVKFNQPSTSSLALNQIFQSSPSQIFGSVSANGQIYLINQNGIIFGPSAQVNANSLIASSLGISSAALSGGILSPALIVPGAVLPAFASSRLYVTDANGNIVTDSTGRPTLVQVLVQPGARISSDPAGGGRVALFGQQVDNSGQISSPSGQVILAAGQKIYLQASSDDTLRGLLVEVDAGGSVWNRLNGSISAQQGNVTLLGLAVNQDGRVSATTSVNNNGSIMLLAQDTTALSPLDGKTITGTVGGALELGAHSTTSVLPELDSSATAVNDQPQNPSTITLSGQQIHLTGGSQVTAPGGTVTLSADSDPSQLALAQGRNAAPVYDPLSEIRIDAGALIDVAGSNVTLPMSANLVSVQLRATELADDPLQRNGPLRGQTIIVDRRVGTPIADVSGEIAAIPYTVGERTAAGGAVTISSAGDAVLAQGATINVSGGSVSYTGGVIATSKLIGANGQIYDVGTASPNQQYVGVINPTYTSTDSRWGVVRTVNGPSIGTFEPGYVQGQNAGSVQFEARELIVNGNLVGHAVEGPLQRTAATQALGGSLTIGAPGNANGSQLDYWAPSVTFSDTVPDFVADLSHPLPSGLAAVLPTDYLDSGGFTNTQIYSNGAITLAANMPLALAPYSRMSLHGESVDIESNIRAPSGTLILDAIVHGTGVALSNSRPGVTLGADVHLDMSGEWVNDSPTLVGPNPVDATPINGGSVQLTNSAVGSLLTVGPDVGIDVSAGAWAQASGAITRGSAGSISISTAHRDSGLTIGDGLVLSGYGFQGTGGGTLSISAPRIEIAHGDAPWTATQSVDFAQPTAGAFVLSDALFGLGGFSSYNVAATGPQGATTTASVDPLAIDAGVQIKAQQLTRLLNSQLVFQPTEKSPNQLFPVALLPQYQRSPVALSFSVKPDTSWVTPANAGDLTVAAGASVAVDPGSSISLSAPTNVRIDGELHAPAGSISVTLATPPAASDPGYVPTQGIYLGADSALLAQGTVQYVPNDLGLLQGQVLAGGQVSLTALRGSVFLQPGSLIDVSGVSAAVDIEQTKGTQAVVTEQTVASAGGTIALTAVEGMQLGGRLLANSGTPTGAVGPAGGTLDMTLSRAAGFSESDDVLALTFPQTPRTILVAAGSGTTTNASMLFDPSLIAHGGFSALSLAADNSIQLAEGTTLDLAQSLALRAPNVAAVPGTGVVSLSAPYVGLGPTNPLTQAAMPSTLGSASLLAQAGLIELTGNTSLQGFGSATLSAASDLRTIGVVNGTQLTGSFNASGGLLLRAADIYPTTLSQFTINDSGTITTQSAAAARPVLEAGGALTLSANIIDNGGSIESPLGQITLDAQKQLTLEPGSLVTVSGQGQTIPFGYTVDGLSWAYTIKPGVVVTISKPPAKGITLSAANVQVQSGAKVDLSGGGELYAYEYLPGTGGTTDALSVANAGNTYAIVPGYGPYAPYDTEENNPNLQPGASVFLSGIPGILAAGTYALLPARYALLPGAFLVTPVSNTTNLQPGSGQTLGDGTPIVSGYYTVADTALRDSLSSGFAVRPGSYGRELAQYNDTYGSAFFQSAAVNSGAIVPQLPIDSGALTVAATQSLTLAGTFATQPATGGRGASVDVAASNLQIVTPAANQAAPGTVQISGDELSNLNAQSLLLGGTRSTTSDGLAIDVTAENVSIESGVSLSSPEILITAQDTITVNGGAKLSASGAPPGYGSDLQLNSVSGSSALLRLSSAGQVMVQRTNPNPAAGTLDVASGAVLSASSSITLSSTADTRSNGTLDAHGGSVSLESSLISLGDAGGVNQGLVLSNAQLADFDTLSELQLISQSSIDFYGNVALGATATQGKASLGSLLLDTPQLRGFGNGSSTARLTAGAVRFANDTSGSPSSAGTGSGTLSIDSHSMELDGGVYGFSGFNRVNLSSHGDLLAQGNVAVGAGSDLVIASARLIPAPGATLSVDASGHSLTLDVPSGAVASGSSAGAGAMLSFTAANIEDAGVIVAPSGQVQLEAAQSLTLTSGAAINTAGVVSTLGGSSVSSPGGSVALRADAGDVSVAAGATINVSGAASGTAAGTVIVVAGGTADLQGSFIAASASDESGGSFQVTAGQLNDFDSLNTLLNTGGFSFARQIEIGSGDLVVAAADTVQARSVTISVDAGSLTVNGLIDAQGRQGGSIQLYARDNLTLGPTGRLAADSSAVAATGGSVELGSVEGQIATNTGSVISVAGPAAGGTVRLRAAADGTGVQIAALDGSITGASTVTAEVVRTYDNVTQIDTGFIAQVHADLANFDANATTIAQTLGKAGDPTFFVVPAVEVRSSGDLTLASPWDLSTWRTASGGAGELTLRAPGNLNIDATLSDGFATSGTGGLTQLAGASWGYRLVGGANLAAADPDTVLPLAALASSSGDVALASGASVRTGTGEIRVNAGRDLQFADQTAVIFTAGVPAMHSIPSTDRTGTLNFSTGGGNVIVAAGNDIIGAPTDQIDTGWLLRQGFFSATWGVDFGQFQAGIGALGGGDVTVSAARDIVNLSVAVPTSGQVDATTGQLTTWGGGNLTVQAGRDLLGGSFYVAHGTGLIAAARTIGDGQDVYGDAIAPVLALGSGSMNATAGNGLTVDSVLNPTMLGQLTDNFLEVDYFFTYDQSSAAHLLALSGALTLVNDEAGIENALPGAVGNGTPLLATVTYPGSVSAVALNGDIDLSNQMQLFPSATGSLNLIAAKNVNLNGNIILESDALPVAVPTPTHPLLSIADISFGLATAASGALHLGNSTAVDHIVAAAGDITDGGLFLPQPADLIAGRDISDVLLVGQNLLPTDTTLLQAGRDIDYSTAPEFDRITLGGPGSLDLLAGRNINLGFTQGISTVGAEANPLLPAGGAEVNILAGLGKQPAYSAFASHYLENGSTYTSDLVSYVEAETGANGLDAASALAAFRALPSDDQLPLILSTFFTELRDSGREANTVPGAGFARGFTAINTLFPGSTLADGSTTPASMLPYSGDLELYFSRIYTVAGGGINLLVPGGLINVGLTSTPPGVSMRSASDLGIVTEGPGDLNAFAYGSVLVNQSRIFTLDGGNITIWSSTGNIDAGRGAKTAISAPPPVITVDQQGNVVIDFTGAVAGSGIRTIQTDPRYAPGNVDLIAPVGTVNAGDAGIGSAGNLNIAAATVVGVDNIQAAGTVTGVPLATNSLAASLSGATNTGSAATRSAEDTAAPPNNEGSTTSVSESALSWLEVFVLGLGEDNCKPEDRECLMRQKSDGK